MIDLTKQKLSELQRFYSEIIHVDYLHDFSHCLALAHLHEWLAYNLKSEAAITRHARYAELFFEAAEESRRQEAKPWNRHKPSKYYAQRYKKARR